MSNTTTSAFIDLATYDELEKYLYGGRTAITYFVKCFKKATWFSQIPVTLRVVGTIDFGGQFTAEISRSGDYMLYNWLRIQIPTVTATQTTGGERINWTRKLMHNFIQLFSVTFNDLTAQEFDSRFFDFWQEFTVRGSKDIGYNNMIGDIAALTTPAITLPTVILNLPIPAFYSRDSGVALPTAAIPYNEMRLNFTFRTVPQLLIFRDIVAPVAPRPVAAGDVGGALPTIGNGVREVWANYAIVSNRERSQMGKCPRDIVIEQVQRTQLRAFDPNANATNDIRFSHSVKAIFFSSELSGNAAERSNYTTAIDYAGVDPIDTTSLLYENTQRLVTMGSDYFSLVAPFYHADRIPFDTGYHAYFYTLDLVSTDPMGSTNYGKLTNASTIHAGSAAAIAAAAGGATWNLIINVVNNNIIRISGGALGFPVL